MLHTDDLRLPWHPPGPGGRKRKEVKQHVEPPIVPCCPCAPDLDNWWDNTCTQSSRVVLIFFFFLHKNPSLVLKPTHTAPDIFCQTIQMALLCSLSVMHNNSQCNIIRQFNSQKKTLLNTMDEKLRGIVFCSLAGKEIQSVTFRPNYNAVNKIFIYFALIYPGQLWVFSQVSTIENWNKPNAIRLCFTFLTM